MSRVIVSHEHRLIFLKTRKTAGTSVEIALSRICGPDDTITALTDEDEELRRSLGGRGPQHYESPPLARKAFNHMPARGVRAVVGRDVWRDYFKLTVERNPWDMVVSQYFWRFREEEAPPFEEFVRRPVVQKLAETNGRIYRLRGRVAADKVCRFETLDADLAEVWERLALPGSPELPRAKSHSRPRRASYREMYDAASRERVREAFADVIADLGYEF